MDAESKITHLERRRIEAGVLVPMIQAMKRELGAARANEIARGVIVELARRDGERWGAQFGTDLAALDRVAAVWAAGGSLEIQPLRRTDKVLEFNVTRCRYAEYFKELGLPELGMLFHCARDFAMVEGFNPGIGLQRTHTLMEGASHCDFRFAAK